MLCNDEMRQGILARLHGYRYEHTLGCERAARKLAERFGGDPEKAGVAAILHDITKHLSPQEQLNLCEKYGIIPCTVEKSEPKMLHGKTAAAIAREEYDMPEDICDAIACHTTGKYGMTLLDKILYLADYIEDTRDFPGVEKARELARKSIDRALLYCYDQTLTELVQRGKLIHSDTIAAYNDMIRHGIRWRDE
ncbi:bis(5'-nucleosyl)-tetraphosphatase (symmetrical) YqeK [uncultured Agathobaculum sp.]|uniref:bis(5'-nucleosyl)-tetraphosphatase (symmetrical) YqeK n=1 Tax=uncultured Agathobaculum sp. TaxID=2048140 RepID=UPI00262CD3D5|nr:bis(5'-nucleosyl)-tetraphosphatase (symmetrical) YqeK [uncultured Agathobaculum sp.]